MSRFTSGTIWLPEINCHLLPVTLIAPFGRGHSCGCGKKAPPIPPDSLVPGEVRNFSVQQDGQALSLQWLIPKVNVDNQPLTDIQGFQILRSVRKTVFSPPAAHRNCFLWPK